jgi:hypothetical protein
MPITGIPDPQRHRICRRCQKWFEAAEGRVLGAETNFPFGLSDRARFQCDRCTRIRRNTQFGLWAALLGIGALVLLLERLGVLS